VTYDAISIAELVVHIRVHLLPLPIRELSNRNQTRFRCARHVIGRHFGVIRSRLAIIADVARHFAIAGRVADKDVTRA